MNTSTIDQVRSASKAQLNGYAMIITAINGICLRRALNHSVILILHSVRTSTRAC